MTTETTKRIRIINTKTGEVLTEISGPSLEVEVDELWVEAGSFAEPDENQITLFEEEN